MKPGLKTLLLLMGGTALAGCANIPKGTQVGVTSLNYNRVVADVKDELLLLNIARASQGRPMHFTRITNIKNSTTVQTGAELGGIYPDRGGAYENTIGIGGAPTSFVENISSAAKTLTPKISGSYSINPIIDYEVQDSKEFYNGILDPIDQDLYAHYQVQGWPSKFLAMLFIENIIFGVDDPEPKIFNNDPDGDGIDDFRNLVECSKFSTKQVDSSPTDFNVEGSLDAAALEKISNVLEKPNWSANSEKQMKHATRGHVVKVNFKDCPDSLVPKKYKFEESVELFQHGRERKKSVDSKFGGTLRSTQGVMYYLGECLRVSGNPCHYNEETKKVIFVSKIQRDSWGSSNGRNGKKALKVRLHGEEFYVPEYTAGDRTFMSLSLVSQLFALQQEAKDPPSTGAFISLN